VGQGHAISNRNFGERAANVEIKNTPLFAHLLALGQLVIFVPLQKTKTFNFNNLRTSQHCPRSQKSRNESNAIKTHLFAVSRHCWLKEWGGPR
jgi:hypothetical protein